MSRLDPQKQDNDRWAHVRDQLSDDLGEAVFSSWLKPLRFEKLDNGILKLTAPTRFIIQCTN